MRSRVLVILLFSSILASASAGAESARVVTKDNALRENCRFFSPVKIVLHYDDAVDLLSTSGDWFRARAKGVDGCIHKTAVQKSNVSLSGLKAGEKQTSQGGHSATESEVSLAGKGFTQEVEDELRSENPEMKFDLVEKIEQYEVSEYDLFEFITKGRLLFPQ